MGKKSRISKITIMMLIMTFSISTVCLAAEYNFSAIKVSVDSNTYSYVGAAIKDTASTTGEVKITEIYKADGSSSNYKKVWVRATISGTGVSVEKGSWTEVPLPSSYQKKGDSVTMYAMGNDPTLDCKISGYWNVH